MVIGKHSMFSSFWIFWSFLFVLFVSYAGSSLGSCLFVWVFVVFFSTFLFLRTFSCYQIYWSKCLYMCLSRFTCLRLPQLKFPYKYVIWAFLKTLLTSLIPATFTKFSGCLLCVPYLSVCPPAYLCVRFFLLSVRLSSIFNLSFNIWFKNSTVFSFSAHASWVKQFQVTPPHLQWPSFSITSFFSSHPTRFPQLTHQLQKACFKTTSTCNKCRYHVRTCL